MALLGPKGGLVAGLDELLTGMRPGEKRRALIPPALGYVRRVAARAVRACCQQASADNAHSLLRRDGLMPQPPDFGQRRQVSVHSKEPLVFEVRLVKIRKV